LRSCDDESVQQGKTRASPSKRRFPPQSKVFRISLACGRSERGQLAFSRSFPVGVPAVSDADDHDLDFAIIDFVDDPVG
jgi:hypothetical protein